MGKDCNMAHCDKLHGKPTPPTTRKVAPLKTSGGAHPKGELESQSVSDDAAAGKPNAKASAAKKVGCIIPAKTAAATTLMLATAASIMQPGTSITAPAPDACLHVGAENYHRLDALCSPVLSSFEDEDSRFREL